jgi:hypothetical protein
LRLSRRAVVVQLKGSSADVARCGADGSDLVDDPFGTA